MMKKLFFLSLAMVVISISASAQLNLGIGYANSNTLHKGEIKTAGHTLRGFFAEVGYSLEAIDDFLDIVPGVRYTILSSGKDASKNAEQHLDIPIMADLGYNFSDDFRLFALAGPTFSIMTASTIPSGNSFDMMIGLGVGADILEHLRIKVTFDQGLLSRYNKEGGSNVKRNLACIGASFLF